MIVIVVMMMVMMMKVITTMVNSLDTMIINDVDSGDNDGSGLSNDGDDIYPCFSMPVKVLDAMLRHTYVERYAETIQVMITIIITGINTYCFHHHQHRHHHRHYYLIIALQALVQNDPQLLFKSASDNDYMLTLDRIKVCTAEAGTYIPIKFTQRRLYFLGIHTGLQGVQIRALRATCESFRCVSIR